MLNRNIFFPSLVIILSLLVLVFISQFPEPMYQDASVGAGFFPAVVTIIQILICAVLIIQHMKKQKKSEDVPLISSHSVFGISFIIGYAVLITLAGYLIASLVGFIAYLLYYRIKKPLYYVIACIFVFSIYFLFGEVFLISLPEGLLFY